MRYPKRQTKYTTLGKSHAIDDVPGRVSRGCSSYSEFIDVLKAEADQDNRRKARATRKPVALPHLKFLDDKDN